MQRRLIGATLRKWLSDETGGKEVGLAEAPSEKPKMPYAILYPTPGTTTVGGFSDPNNILTYIFQVTSVGRSHEQAAAMSDAVFNAILGTKPNGDWLHALDLGGTPAMSVVDRRLDSFGGIVPSGDNMFISPDTYRIEVQ